MPPKSTLESPLMTIEPSKMNVTEGLGNYEDINQLINDNKGNLTAG